MWYGQLFDLRITKPLEYLYLVFNLTVAIDNQLRFVASSNIPCHTYMQKALATWLFFE